MNWIRILQWISIVMCWVAIGMNIYAMIRMKRTQRELENQVRIWKARNNYEEVSDEGTN